MPVRHSTGVVPWAVAHVSLELGAFRRVAQRPRDRIMTPRKMIQRDKGVQSHSPLALPRRGLGEGAERLRRGVADVGGKPGNCDQEVFGGTGSEWLCTCRWW